MFDETAKAHFRCTEQFGVACLHQRRQHDIQRSIQARAGQNTFGDGVCAFGRRWLVVAGLIEQAIERFGCIE
ncbi:MAG: hypothetical protein Q7U39_13620 [Nitrospira sp.]|nr:hypothetical protein [Nitrospira sp.]